MELDKKSRYAGTPLIAYTHPSGEEYQLRQHREIPRLRAVYSHTPIDGDRLDQIAARYYRDPLVFWRIADTSDHLDPFDIVFPGDPVAVPPNR